MDEQSSSRTYHWCIVPKCTNTSFKTPQKVFLQVPRDEKRTKVWFNAIRRSHKGISLKATLFICEDHFDLEEDLENYRRLKLMGGKKILKKHVVPHKFDCQLDRKRASTTSTRETTVKRIRKQLIDDLLINPSNDETSSASLNIEPGPDEQPNLPSTFEQSEQFQPEHPPLKATISRAIMVKPQVRNKGVQTSAFKCDKCKLLKVKAKNKEEDVRLECVISSDESSDKMTTSSRGFSPSLTKGSTSTSDTSVALTQKKEKGFLEAALKHTMRIVNLNPRRYLGVPKECLFIIDLLQKYTLVDTNGIHITLQKIRLGQTFIELGDAYGLSESVTSRKFSNAVGLISQLFKELIIWPHKDKIKENLPLAFRARYSKVESIIDCFEIEISKPMDAVKQALTWSDYKKANTIKYLISSTPDGIINFISQGFGGRTSDAVIVQESKYLDCFQPGSVIMADRGFKHIEHLLIQRQCTLLRPPSVAAGQKLDKHKVLETKRIASLRIHIECVIRRLREFKILKPHSCVHSKLISSLDDMVIIACGLINLQGPIVK